MTLPGKVIDIIAPGWACDKADLAKAIRYMKSIGLNPRTPKNFFGHHPYFSNTVEMRWKHLKQALLSKDSHIIWCVRGGSGTADLLPHLKKIKKPKTKKILLGYSDITALHIYLNNYWHWPSWHGPLVEKFKPGSMTAVDLKQAEAFLFGKKTEVHYKGLKALNKAASKKRNIKAHLGGGNLCLVQTSLATSWQIKSRGQILFFEEVGERGYSVSRSLSHLKQSGVFTKVKAIVFGEFTGGKECNGRDYNQRMLKEFAESMEIPVLKGLPIGHGRSQKILPLGVTAYLTTGTQAELTAPSGF